MVCFASLPLFWGFFKSSKYMHHGGKPEACTILQNIHINFICCLKCTKYFLSLCGTCGYTADITRALKYYLLVFYSKIRRLQLLIEAFIIPQKQLNHNSGSYSVLYALLAMKYLPSMKNSSL